MRSCCSWRRIYALDENCDFIARVIVPCCFVADAAVLVGIDGCLSRSLLSHSIIMGFFQRILSFSGLKVERMPGSDCSLGKMNIPHSSNPFEALHLQIHLYSEHEIAGRGIGNSGFFPAELHVLHHEKVVGKNGSHAKDKNKGDDDGSSYAMFATMISAAPNNEDHEQFEWFLKGWEAVATQVAQSCPVPKASSSSWRHAHNKAGHPMGEARPMPDFQCSAVHEEYPHSVTHLQFPDADLDPKAGHNCLFPDVYALPTARDWGVYTYKGSFTSPNCVEKVHWNLLDQPMEISENQLARLEYLILCYVRVDRSVSPDGQTTKIDYCEHGTVASATGSTSRPPQPLLGRTVLHRCKDGPAIAKEDVGVMPIADGDKYTPPPHKQSSYRPHHTETSQTNFKDNAEVWNTLEGYWVGTMQVHDHKWNPMMETFASSRFKRTLPYPRDNVAVFLNRTIHGSQYAETQYHVYKPVSVPNDVLHEGCFCRLPVPEEATNVLGKGICGVNGYAQVGQKFGTAIPVAPVGMAWIFQTNGMFSDATGGDVVPIDENTIYNVIESQTFEWSQTEHLNSEQGIISGTGLYQIKSSLPPYSINSQAELYTFELKRVSADDFVDKLHHAYADNNVLPSDQKPIIQGGNCLDETACPTAEEFARLEPDHHYDFERDGLHPGWVAGIVLFGIVLLAAVAWFAYDLYLFHILPINRLKRKMLEQGIPYDDGVLDPVALGNVFASLDSDGDGLVRFDDLKTYMGDKMTPDAFDSTFATVDVDNTRAVDMAQFLGFMTLHARPRLVLCMMKWKRKRRAAPVDPINHRLCLLIKRARLGEGLFKKKENKEHKTSYNNQNDGTEEEKPFMGNAINNADAPQEVDARLANFSTSGGSFV